MASLVALAVLVPLLGGLGLVTHRSVNNPAPEISDPETRTREEKTEWIRLRDGRIMEYRTFGAHDGTAVFIFPGNFQTCNAFAETDRLRECFTQRNLRYVSPSYPGFGLSDAHPPGKISPAVEWWPGDIEQLADSLGIDKFYILSHSLGGMYAAATIQKMPARVLGCVLASPIIPMPIQLTLDHRMPKVTKLFYKLFMKPYFRELVSMSMASQPIEKVLEASPDSAQALNKMREEGGAYEEIGNAIYADCNRAISNTWRGLACTMELISHSWGFELNGLSSYAQSGKRFVIAAAVDDVTNPNEFHQWLNREINGSRLLDIKEGWGHMFVFEPQNLELLISCLLEKDIPCF